MSTPAPFGLILPSRPVLTNPLTVSPTQYAFTFPSTPSFSHLIVFLLPGATLPDGTLAGVYIQLPTSAPEFKLLGAIGTEKQSAVFRVKGTGAGSENYTVEDEMTDVDGIPAGADVTVGISIEPAANLAAQLEILKASQNTPSAALVSATGQQQRQSPLSAKVLAQRIIKNAFNFLASFAGSTSVGGQEVVPLKSFQDWWTKFERRIENDPGFLERDEDG